MKRGHIDCEEYCNYRTEKGSQQKSQMKKYDNLLMIVLMEDSKRKMKELGQ